MITESGKGLDAGSGAAAAPGGQHQGQPQPAQAAAPAAVVVGIPAYLNGFAAIPLMAGMIDLGMNEGAALAFMIAGGVTSIPAAMAVFALVRRQVFAWYVALSLTGSLAAGFFYQLAISG